MHTPGPWVAHHQFADWNFPYIVTIEALSGDFVVATVEGGNVLCFGTESNTRKNALAIENARLIAAAPELLQALKEAVECLNQYETAGVTVHMLEQVIAKAEGRA